MSQNDIVILNNIINSAGKSEKNYFSLFSFEQILKNYDLSFDELKSGFTDGEDDGGIDGFFTFVNNNLLVEPDLEESLIKKGAEINVYIIQTKTSASFGEDFFEKVNITIANIFDLTKDLKKLKALYNSAILEKVELFRYAISTLSRVYPQINITYCYASKGDTSVINKKIIDKGELVKKQTLKQFPGHNIEIKFFGARELLELARQKRSYNLNLEFIEHLSRGQNDYVVLSSLESFYNFVVDEEGNLRRDIFDSNVRDYQGNIEVNKDISNTLETEKDLDFWWLNNGITILAKKAGIAGKKITLEDVQIVNGLQTTNCVYQVVREDKSKFSKKYILIKIIISDDPEARDKIIKATNFQTRIPAASLRATDSFQRDLEEYFKKSGWYYDRKKNYYKNLGIEASKIISIPYLAQSITSLILKEPNIARSRPSSLVKDDNDYQRVFDDHLGFEIYLRVATIMKKIDEILRSETPNYSIPEKTNFRFHIALYLVAKLLGKNYHKEDLQKIKSARITKKLVNKVMNKVLIAANKYSDKNGGTLDSVAKSKNFTDFLLTLI